MAALVLWFHSHGQSNLHQQVMISSLLVCVWFLLKYCMFNLYEESSVETLVILLFLLCLLRTFLIDYGDRMHSHLEGISIECPNIYLKWMLFICYYLNCLILMCVDEVLFSNNIGGICEETMWFARIWVI